MAWRVRWARFSAWVSPRWQPAQVARLPVDEGLGGVDTLAFQGVVAHGRLDQYRQVAAGRDRDGDQRDRDVENLALPNVAGETGHGVRIVLVAFTQRFQVDDETQVFGCFYRHVAEHLADVEHAKAAYLQQILQQVGAGTVDEVGGDEGEFGGVVGHEAMATGDQFQGQFALARAGLASDQHADGKHFQEHAVQRGLGRELACQVVLQVGQQLVAALLARPQGRVGLVGDVAQIRGNRLVLGDDQGHRLVGDDLVQDFPALPRIEPIQEAQFFGTDDLDVVRVDDVEVANERWSPFARHAWLQDPGFAAHAGYPTQRHALMGAVKQLSRADPIQAGVLMPRGSQRSAQALLCQLAAAP